MIKNLALLLFIGFAEGQNLHFTNNDKTIKIETGEKLQLNGDKYTLVKTVYSKEYVIVKKYKSSIHDTLKFNSIVSFKYYEKSLRSFASSVLKGAKYGALFGAVGTVIDGEIKYGIHWTILYSILFGSCGSFGGAIYGILNPMSSQEMILEKERWYISN